MWKTEKKIVSTLIMRKGQIITKLQSVTSLSMETKHRNCFTFEKAQEKAVTTI
jgi:hypothetical protein